MSKLLNQLTSADRRSIGLADKGAVQVLSGPARFGEVFAGQDAALKPAMLQSITLPKLAVQP